MLTLLLGTMILLVPFIISSLEKKVKPIEWLSPIVCCYALGILMGNVLVDIWDMNLARTISEVSVMLALPLLLFSVDLIGWAKLAKTTIISFILLIFCVM